jgi:hypothetical protein
VSIHIASRKVDDAERFRQELVGVVVDAAPFGAISPLAYGPADGKFAALATSDRGGAFRVLG